MFFFKELFSEHWTALLKDAAKIMIEHYSSHLDLNIVSDLNKISNHETIAEIE